MEVRSSVDSLGRVRDFVETCVRGGDLSADRAAELVLAVDEAVSNVIEHGYRAGDGAIVIEIVESREAFLVRIRDDAPLFDPTCPQDPLPSLSPLERDRPGGYGRLLVAKLVDEVSYRVTDDGRNELALLKRRQ